jgi:hypothetical protein
MVVHYMFTFLLEHITYSSTSGTRGPPHDVLRLFAVSAPDLMCLGSQGPLRLAFELSLKALTQAPVCPSCSGYNGAVL